MFNIKKNVFEKKIRYSTKIKKHLGYVSFPENTKKRKNIQKKMIFSCLIVL